MTDMGKMYQSRELRQLQDRMLKHATDAAFQAAELYYTKNELNAAGLEVVLQQIHDNAVSALKAYNQLQTTIGRPLAQEEFVKEPVIPEYDGDWGKHLAAAYTIGGNMRVVNRSMDDWNDVDRKLSAKA